MRNGILSMAISGLLLVPVAVRAETSVSCVYLLMNVYHAEMDACHVMLPADKSGRYVRLKTELEHFILANAKNDPKKIFFSVDSSTKRGLAGLKSCQSEDFAAARQGLGKLLTPESENYVSAMLSSRHDPQDGTCSD